MIKRFNTISQSQKRQLAVLILALLIGLVGYYFLSSSFQTRQDESATLSPATKAEMEHSLQLGVIHEQKPSDELLREHSGIDVANLSPRSEDIVPYEEKAEDTTGNADTVAPPVKQAKIIPPTPAGYYYLAAAPPANDKYDFGEWAAAPVSVTEITAKRQKIAQGERLYKRVIVKRPDPFGRPTTIDDISGVAN